MKAGDTLNYRAVYLTQNYSLAPWINLCRYPTGHGGGHNRNICHGSYGTQNREVLRKYVDLLMTLDLVSIMGMIEVKDYSLWLGTQMSLGSRVGHRTLIVLSFYRIEMVNSKSF